MEHSNPDQAVATSQDSDSPRLPDVVDFSTRAIGCTAVFRDGGLLGGRNIPVCMGGTEIKGCTNWEECDAKLPQYPDHKRKFTISGGVVEVVEWAPR